MALVITENEREREARLARQQRRYGPSPFASSLLTRDVRRALGEPERPPEPRPLLPASSDLSERAGVLIQPGSPVPLTMFPARDVGSLGRPFEPLSRATTSPLRGVRPLERPSVSGALGNITSALGRGAWKAFEDLERGAQFFNPLTRAQDLGVEIGRALGGQGTAADIPGYVRQPARLIGNPLNLAGIGIGASAPRIAARLPGVLAVSVRALGAADVALTRASNVPFEAAAAVLRPALRPVGRAARAVGQALPTPPVGMVDLQPFPAAERLFGLRAPTAGLRPSQRALNVLKETVGVGTPDDPITAAVVGEVARVRPGAESQARRLAGEVGAIARQAFQFDNQGRILGLEGNALTAAVPLRRPTLQDVAARLPEYQAALTPRQAEAMARIQELFEPYGALYREAGIETGIRADVRQGGFYLPRGRADLEGADAPVRAGVRRTFGRGKTGAERPAVFDSMAEGIEAGYRYSPLEQSLEAYARDASDRSLTRWMETGLRTARDEAGAPVASTVAERAAALEARGVEPGAVLQERARQVPRGQGVIQTPGLGLSGTTFPQAMAASANHLLAQMTPPSGGPVVAQVALAVNRLLRGVEATFDLSFMGIQGLLGVVRAPTAYASALSLAARSYDPLAHGRFIQAFDERMTRLGAPSSEQWLRSGVRMLGSTTEFTIGQGRLRPVASFPPFALANRMFGYFGDALRLELAAVQHQSALRRGIQITEREMADMARLANLATGVAEHRLGGEIGEFAFFAPRFFQSQLELLARGLVDGSLAGQEARNMAVRLMGAAVLVTVVVNEARGKTTVFSPLDPNFLRILDVAGSDITVLGPWNSLVQGLLGLATGEPTRLVRSRSSPLVSALWDAIAGENAIGERLTTEQWLTRLLPFSVSDLPEVVRGERPLSSLLIGVTGLRATPRSLGEQRADILQGIFERLPEEERRGAADARAFTRETPSGTAALLPVATPEERVRLAELDRRGRERRPTAESALRASVSQEIQDAARDAERAGPVGKIEFREAVDDIRLGARQARERAGTEFPAATTQRGKDREAWFATWDEAKTRAQETGEDWRDALSALQGDLIASLGSERYQAVLEDVYAVTDPEAPALLLELSQVRRDLAATGFHDLRTALWRDAIASGVRTPLGLPSGFSSIFAYQKALGDAVRASMAPGALESAVLAAIQRVLRNDPLSQSFADQLNNRENLWVARNPRLAEQAVEWGYLRPTAHQRAILQGALQPAGGRP